MSRPTSSGGAINSPPELQDPACDGVAALGFLNQRTDGAPTGAGEDAAAFFPVGENCVRADVCLDAAAVAAAAQASVALDDGVAPFANTGMGASREPAFG